MKVLGEDDLHEYVHRYDLKIPKEVKKLMKGKEFPKQDYKSFVNDKNKDMVDDDALDLLEKML